MKLFVSFCTCALLAVLFSTVHASEPATIAIIGTGDMGNSLGPRFAELGYRVIYGSRNPESETAINLVAQTGNDSSVTTQISAAEQADIVALAVRWPAVEQVVKSLHGLDGKILIDMTVSWRQADDGYPEMILPTTAAELIQQWQPRAKVVKAFATAGSNLIDDPAAAGGIVSMPLASDHRDAKETVAQLVAEMGFQPVDFGPLRMSQHIESLQVVWLIPAFQRREAGWEYYFRRSEWPPEWQLDAWSSPTSDAGALARMPDVKNP
jgi:predicted dinucleotide-binding enzyme